MVFHITKLYAKEKIELLLGRSVSGTMIGTLALKADDKESSMYVLLWKDIDSREKLTSQVDGVMEDKVINDNKVKKDGS